VSLVLEHHVEHPKSNVSEFHIYLRAGQQPYPVRVRSQNLEPARPPVSNLQAAAVQLEGSVKAVADFRFKRSSGWLSSGLKKNQQ